ncbi:hypothetical protein HYT02_01835 [Candidatus Gottesmanbacteria bacterium]|nr:hypothetical protein [Candidatus Gottesmanbacteria bacterium]
MLKKAIWLGVFLIAAVILSSVHPKTTQANHIPYATGDIFAGVGGGQIYRYDQTGALIEVLNTTSGSSEQTGMCFDASSNLYSTNFTAQNMTKFDNMGGVLTHPWAGPFGLRPESCVVDGAGNIYTGEVDGAEQIRKWDSAGNSLGSFSPTTGPRGVDWIDLSADQCTMLYTSEGSTVHSFDVCTNTQNPDFATGLTGPCFALRIRGNSEVMVTCSTQTYRLDAAGNPMQTYPIGGEFLFAMNLDPNGTHFWTGGYSTRNIYKVDIASGLGTGAPVFTAAVVGPSLAGLAIFGEPTVSQPGITLDPPTDTNPAGTEHTVTATVTAGGNPVPNVLVNFSVTSGPNTGATGTCSVNADCTTDGSGQVSWTYQSNGSVGTDVIQACFTDEAGVEHCARAEKEWIDTTPPKVSCTETVNPHGKNVPPAGSTTLPGSRGGQNEDGFYELFGRDNIPGLVSIFITDALGSGPFGPFSSLDKVKITEAPGTTPSSKPMGSTNGQAGAIVAHITLNSDALVYGVDLAGNQSGNITCLVPPPPK